MAKRKETAPKPFCFVLMPFAPSFNDVYGLGIKAACEIAGAYCERVDEQIHQEQILNRVCNQIAKADIVIADMSGRNPNVFYEVGYAHALNKLAILLTNNADDIPFDLKPFPHIVYSSGISYLRTELAKRVSHYVKEGFTTGVEVAFPIKLFVNRQDAASITEPIVLRKRSPFLQIFLENQGLQKIAATDYALSVITDKFIDVTTGSIPMMPPRVQLPDSRLLQGVPSLGDLFPNMPCSVGITLSRDEPNAGPPPGEHVIVFRIATSSGSTDFVVHARWDIPE